MEHRISSLSKYFEVNILENIKKSLEKLIKRESEYKTKL